MSRILVGSCRDEQPLKSSYVPAPSPGLSEQIFYHGVRSEHTGTRQFFDQILEPVSSTGEYHKRQRNNPVGIHRCHRSRKLQSCPERESGFAETKMVVSGCRQDSCGGGIREKPLKWPSAAFNHTAAGMALGLSGNRVEEAFLPGEKIYVLVVEWLFRKRRLISSFSSESRSTS